MSPHVKPTKIPQERDFTGGMIHSKSCAFIGSTGEKNLDEKLMKLASEISGDDENCLLSEMLISAVRISRGAVTEGDFKTMNRALKEMRIANEVFTISGMMAHNLSKEIQMLEKPKEERSAPKRPSLWNIF